MTQPNPCKVRGLGEVAIRCDDVIVMRDFYRDVVGLEVMKDSSREGGIVFFRIAEGFGGHTAILALFDKGAGSDRGHQTGTERPETGARSSLHHLALEVAFEEQEALMQFLDVRRVVHRVQDFDWVGWRGIFIEDPEGNTVEFVAGTRGKIG